MTPIIDRVAKLVEAGYESNLIPVIERLEAKSNIPESLRAKFEALGSNPISEPAIYEAINSGELDTLALQVLTEDEIKSLSASEIGDFIFAVEKKVTDYKNDDGTFKSTPNTEDCRLPNFLEAAQIRKLFIKQNDLVAKFSSEKDKTKLTKQIQAVSKEMDDLFIKISGLDYSVLTDWEKALVISMLAGTANNAFLSAQGKRSLG